jgi:hypothetical protein
MGVLLNFTYLSRSVSFFEENRVEIMLGWHSWGPVSPGKEGFHAKAAY